MLSDRSLNRIPYLFDELFNDSFFDNDPLSL